jgi:hypothetical protein
MTISRRILLVPSFSAAAVSLVAGWSADGAARHGPQARVVSSDLSLTAPFTVGWPVPTILKPISLGRRADRYSVDVRSSGLEVRPGHSAAVMFFHATTANTNTWR